MSKIDQIQVGVTKGLGAANSLNQALKDLQGEGAEIKQEYELQPDTNVYTDAEKAKLASLNENNKGTYVDDTALKAAYPVGQAGWFAVVQSTDTVWVWSDMATDWVDSGTAGQVTSVNGLTGAVLLTTDDIPEDTDKNYVTDSEKAAIGSALRSGDNVSELANDAGYAVATIKKGVEISLLKSSNPNSVSFDGTDLPDVSYSLTVRAFDDDGFTVGYKNIVKSESGFAINVDFDCKIDYTAIR